MTPDQLAAPALLERISALESALLDAQATAAECTARARIAERELSTAKDSGPAAQQSGSRLRRRDRSEGLGQRIEQLIRLAEEQAHDVLAAAKRDAERIRTDALADAAKIRAASL